MSNDKYFEIYNSDGDTSVREYTKKEFLKMLNDEFVEEYGYPSFIGDLDAIDNLDTNYWPENSRLIIKGKVVVPTPEKVVEVYKVE